MSLASDYLFLCACPFTPARILQHPTTHPSCFSSSPASVRFASLIARPFTQLEHFDNTPRATNVRPLLLCGNNDANAALHHQCQHRVDRYIDVIAQQKPQQQHTQHQQRRLPSDVQTSTAIVGCHKVLCGQQTHIVNAHVAVTQNAANQREHSHFIDILLNTECTNML